jgi:glycerophosphoryl diester phosphodiesterase
MWVYPKILAHRGGGKLAPENTLAAMRCGLAHGFRAVEFDVMLSADSIPVLMHDPRFGRTVHGRGKVCETDARRLTAMDAGSWFGPEFAGEPVPTYEQAVRFCKDNGIWMNVEIKPSPGFETETGRVVGEWTQRLFVEEIAAHKTGVNDASLPLFSSFAFDAVAAARVAAPHIPRAFLVEVVNPAWRQYLADLDAVALHTDEKNFTQAQAREIKDAGYGLFCYTVNTPERAREILSWGVDAFCTDRIDLIGPDFAG